MNNKSADQSVPCRSQTTKTGFLVSNPNILGKYSRLNVLKGALSWYGKLTWESAHAWNLIILCLLIAWGMTFIFMVHLSFYAISLLIYDVLNDITTIP